MQSTKYRKLQQLIYAPPEYSEECRPDIGNAAWSNSGVWNSSGAAGKEGLLLRVGEESIVDGVKGRLFN